MGLQAGGWYAVKELGLVVIWEQDGRRRSVGLSDDPETVISLTIGGEQPSAMPEGVLIGKRILRAQIAPVAIGMPLESGQNLLGSEP